MGIELYKGDITLLDLDAIVNAANKSLLGGGGVDGAIHRAAGPGLLNECKLLNGCETGHAKITSGHDLSAKYIIHTVGPVWRGGGYKEAELLENCYRSCMEIANENELRSIAFPNISTGVYGFPKEKAANIAIDTIKEYVRRKYSIEKLVFAVFDEENFKIYSELLK